MSPSSVLNEIDLSMPEKGWIEKLFQLSDIESAYALQEGPQIFYQAQSFKDLEDYWGKLETYTLRSLEGSTPPSYLLEKAQEHIVLSANPDDWIETQEKPEDGTSILYLENPTHSNGACISNNWILKFLKSVPPSKRQILIADESFAAFQWDIGEEIARVMSLSAIILRDWEIYIGWRLQGYMNSGHESLTLWPTQGLAAERVRNIDRLHASPLSWKLLQREFYQEDETLRRRHLARRNLKTLSDKLRPLIEAKKLHIPFWPLAGAWVEIEIKDSQLLKSELIAQRLRHWGLRLIDGKFKISYLRESRIFEAAMGELAEALEKATGI